jgi:hypothetical protein
LVALSCEDFAAETIADGATCAEQRDALDAAVTAIEANDVSCNGVV